MPGTSGVILLPSTQGTTLFFFLSSIPFVFPGTAIMKFISILPFAALSFTFVIPDEEVMSQVAIESHQAQDSVFDKLPTGDQAITQFEKTFSKLIDASQSGFDQAIKYAEETGEQASTKVHQTAFDAEAWLDSTTDKIKHLGKLDNDGHHGHGKPNLTVCVF